MANLSLLGCCRQSLRSMVLNSDIIKSSLPLSSEKSIFCGRSQADVNLKYLSQRGSLLSSRNNRLCCDPVSFYKVNSYGETHRIYQNTMDGTTAKLNSTNKDTTTVMAINQAAQFLYFHNGCSAETKGEVLQSFAVFPNFLTDNEEAAICKEVNRHLERMKYDYNHWDDAIHGFRETEVTRWSKASEETIQRLREKAFPEDGSVITHTHVLDLARDGVIKPHVDSIRFCGNIIAGLSLLTDAVMRFVHCDQKEEKVDILLLRKSLYIMKDASRYKYTHEVLAEKESYFGDQYVPRGRRISVICRNHPDG